MDLFSEGRENNFDKVATPESVSVPLKGKNSLMQIQSTLVISTSLISNNRLSQSENLVPVFNNEI